MVIVAGPGSDKTTCLLQIADAILSRRPELTPIVLAHREYAGGAICEQEGAGPAGTSSA